MIKHENIVLGAKQSASNHRERFLLCERVSIFGKGRGGMGGGSQKLFFYLFNNLQTLPMYSLGLLQGENRRSGCSQIGEGPALGGGMVCVVGGGKEQRKERCWREEKNEQKILRYQGSYKKENSFCQCHD